MDVIGMFAMVAIAYYWSDDFQKTTGWCQLQCDKKWSKNIIFAVTVMLFEVGQFWNT